MSQTFISSKFQNTPESTINQQPFIHSLAAQSTPTLAKWWYYGEQCRDGAGCKSQYSAQSSVRRKRVLRSISGPLVRKQGVPYLGPPPASIRKEQAGGSVILHGSLAFSAHNRSSHGSFINGEYLSSLIATRAL